MRCRPSGLAVLVLAVLLMVIPSAAVADDTLLMSTDGATWSDVLPEPLFDPSRTWVPGDVEHATFLVRNARDEPAELEIEVHGTEAGGLLRTGDLHVATRTAGADWVTVSVPGTRRLSTTEIASASQERVEVRASLDPRSGNDAQRRSADLDFTVRLTQQAGPTDVEPRRDEATGWLPATGSSRSLLLLATAGIAALGLGALVARRRQETHHE